MRKLASYATLLSLVLTLTIVPFGLSQTPPTGQIDQDDVVRVSTTLVTVSVNARDRHGKLVYDLQREDFNLFEDGIKQDLVYFDLPRNGGAQTTTLPLTVALLLDVSDSTEFKLNQIQQAASTFLDQLQPDDLVLLIAFDRNVRVLAAATTDRADLRKAIAHTQTGGG